MGAGNVKLVYARWADLPDGALRLLAYMAVIAMDEGDRPRFWGGRESLALAMGRMVPGKRTGDEDELTERRLAFKAVTRMLGTLKAAGAITPLSGAAPGRNAVYALNLAARQVPLSGSHSSRQQVPSSGSHSDVETSAEPTPGRSNGTHSVGATDPTSWAQWDPLGGSMGPTQRDPEEYKEEVGLNEGVDGAGVDAASHPPRAHESEQPPDSHSPPKPTHCGHGLKIRHRPDGRPSCALCRVAETRPGVAMPISDDHLADVIPLHPEAV